MANRELIIIQAYVSVDVMCLFCIVSLVTVPFWLFVSYFTLVFLYRTSKNVEELLVFHVSQVAHKECA